MTLLTPAEIELLDDKALKEALRDPDKRRSLEGYYGRAQAKELDALLNWPVDFAPGDRPRTVLLIHGVLGSQLSDRGGYFDDMVWVDLSQLTLNDGLEKLRLTADGRRDAKDGVHIVPERPLRLFYDLTALHLKVMGGFRIEKVAFDWRKSIDEGAALLHRRIADIKAGDDDMPIAIVAHSMGSLVTQRYVQQHFDEARRHLVQAVFIAPPLRGSFDPAALFTGQHSLAQRFANVMSGVVTRFEDVFRTFPGMAEMLPDPDLFDCHALYDASSWPDGFITQAHLDHALEFGKSLRDPSEALDWFMPMTTIIRGDHDTKTLGGVYFDQGKMGFSAGDYGGDGTVPSRSSWDDRAKQHLGSKGNHSTMQLDSSVRRALVALLKSNGDNFSPLKKSLEPSERPASFAAPNVEAAPEVKARFAAGDPLPEDVLWLFGINPPEPAADALSNDSDKEVSDDGPPAPSILPGWPLPIDQFHYADPDENPQLLPIDAKIHALHHPTLGCPALLASGAPLRVMLSLSNDRNPEKAAFALIDRHGEGRVHPLGEARDIEVHEKDKATSLYLLTIDVPDTLPDKLYDLRLSWPDGLEEQQPNAVRLYKTIEGNERVVICGDPQYHGDNIECLKRFVDAMNHADLDDVAWIAMIGDVCDNGVKGWKNVVKKALKASARPVTHYYAKEYPEAWAELRRLNKPIFLMPGNHDGMVAFKDYLPGPPSKVYLGGEPVGDPPAYDGLQHFRRTFGPLFHHFDWAGTRYICTNTFELERYDRQGYHSIVANWGGWMRKAQMDWLEAVLMEADDLGLHKVLLMHHDPRGGSKGIHLGRYHLVRDYDLTSIKKILASYLPYVLRHGKRSAQQEWMIPYGEEVEKHPVRRVLELIVEHEISEVFMGHDNHNWIDAYRKGTQLLTEPGPEDFLAVAGEEFDEDRLNTVAQFLKREDYENLLKEVGEDEEPLLDAALYELESDVYGFAPDAGPLWELEVKSPLRFIHVDDVGAYKHGSESDFKDYGYVLVRLKDGRPVGGKPESVNLSRD